MTARAPSAPPGRSILVVSPGGRHDTGGICRVVDDLARAWSRFGHAPPMVVLDSGGMRRGAARIAPCLGALFAVARAGLGGRAALLHIHVASRGSVARKALFVLAGRCLRIPVVLHLHAADFEPFVAARGALGRFLVASTFRLADGVVVLGSRARLHLLGTLGVPSARITAIPNGVAEAEPRPYRSVSGTKCRLAFVGALTARKGLDTLLDALAAPALAGLPLVLDVVGNGDDAPWRDQARHRGVADRLRFHGWQENGAVRRLIAGSDVLVLPSRAEALPVVVLEAMAEGIPVVATTVGEIGDAVLHGETGLLVPPGDPTALAEAIASLATDADRRRRFGEAGRRRVRDRFDLADAAERLDALFAGLVARRGAGRATRANGSRRARPA